MILRYAHLSRHSAVFHAMTGLTVAAFDDLVADLLPACVNAKQQRLKRPDRRRAIGGGRHDDLCWTNQILLTVIWLRTYPTNEVLAYLIGVSDLLLGKGFVLASLAKELETLGHQRREFLPVAAEIGQQPLNGRLEIDKGRVVGIAHDL